MKMQFKMLGAAAALALGMPFGMAHAQGVI